MGEADDMELIYSLIGYPDETEWLEFKESNSDPVERGATSQRLPTLPLTAAVHMPIRSGA